MENQNLQENCIKISVILFCIIDNAETREKLAITKTIRPKQSIYYSLKLNQIRFYGNL